jgi:hypothetical protein
MSKAGQKLFLFEAATVHDMGAVESTGLDVHFPPHIRWSDVLDCRIEPFASRTIADNCQFATGVHKAYILVSQATVERSKA